MISRRLLVVEDEPLVSSLLSETLGAAGFEVTTSSSALEATKVARRIDPDVALLDINLGGGASGVELAFILHKEHPGIALALLTKHPDLRTAGYTEKDVPPGCAYIRKDLITNTSELLRAIEDVVGESTKVRQDNDPSRPFSSLTTSQIDVLRMVAQGFTNNEIAKRRGTSVRAVEQLLNAVFIGLGIPVDEDLNPRVEAVRRFISYAGTPERS